MSSTRCLANLCSEPQAQLSPIAARRRTKYSSSMAPARFFQGSCVRLPGLRVHASSFGLPFCTPPAAPARVCHNARCHHTSILLSDLTSHLSAPQFSAPQPLSSQLSALSSQFSVLSYHPSPPAHLASVTPQSDQQQSASHPTLLLCYTVHRTPYSVHRTSYTIHRTPRPDPCTPYLAR